MYYIIIYKHIYIITAINIYNLILHIVLCFCMFISGVSPVIIIHSTYNYNNKTLIFIHLCRGNPLWLPIKRINGQGQAAAPTYTILLYLIKIILYISSTIRHLSEPYAYRAYHFYMQKSRYAPGTHFKNLYLICPTVYGYYPPINPTDALSLC